MDSTVGISRRGCVRRGQRGGVAFISTDLLLNPDSPVTRTDFNRGRARGIAEDVNSGQGERPNFKVGSGASWCAAVEGAYIATLSPLVMKRTEVVCISSAVLTLQVVKEQRRVGGAVTVRQPVPYNVRI
jgi:hypothetical protein